MVLTRIDKVMLSVRSRTVIAKRKPHGDRPREGSDCFDKIWPSRMPAKQEASRLPPQALQRTAACVLTFCVRDDEIAIRRRLDRVECVNVVDDLVSRLN